MLTTFIGRFTARTGEIEIDPWVLAFTLGVSIVTGLAFGTFPALASRVNLVTALKASGKGTGDSGGRRRLQSALIVAQVAVSVVLLVAAGLLLLSFYKLQRVDPGYQGDRVLSAEIFGNFSKYPNPQSLRRLYVSVLERLEASPGVVSAAVTNGVPLAGVQPGQTRFEIRGVTYENPDLAPTADVRVASPRYFDTLGIPVRRGRAFVELDHEDAPRVVVINESMVRYWEGRDPIGSEVSFNNGQAWSTVVGVVGDVKAFGLDREAVAQVYQPLRQAGGGLQGRALVRMSGRSGGRDRDHPRGGARRGSRRADRKRADAGGDPERVAGHASADGDAAVGVCRAGAAGHGHRHHRRDRDVGVAADAGVRRPHGARRRAAAACWRWC